MNPLKSQSGSSHRWRCDRCRSLQRIRRGAAERREKLPSAKRMISDVCDHIKYKRSAPRSQNSSEYNQDQLDAAFSDHSYTTELRSQDRMIASRCIHHPRSPIGIVISTQHNTGIKGHCEFKNDAWVSFLQMRFHSDIVWKYTLFDFDLEGTPILEVLVGKTLEQASLQVMEEKELAAMGAQQKAFLELCNAELVEMRRLEEKDRRYREKKQSYGMS
ncbi:PREDICTED: uncharacterized protein LOC106816519 isoform X2 [Priapulus caudatus]|uniref:Uncharacterized protein LOC106816519 isoform X2 n=1 Tax=Priapulus caudatus TaxID=37621 RepID=A0ABM1EWR3_PRICU|nr:PREDICTED: uncharacterized protein LOC106816519 isoform X2 [Priapulus caudatus]